MDYDRLRELQEKFEENPRRYFAPLANEYRKGGQPKRAIEICRAQLAQMPGHMSGQIVYGQALYECGEFDEARSVFQRALTLDPENLIALRSLGDMSLQSGDTAEARTWYTRLLDADPKDTAVIALVSEIDAAPAGAPVRTPQEIAGVDIDVGDQAIPFITDETGVALETEQIAPTEATHAAEPAAEEQPPIQIPPEAASSAAPPDGLERHYPDPVESVEAVVPDVPLGAEGLQGREPTEPVGAEGLRGNVEAAAPPAVEGLRGTEPESAEPAGTEGLEGKPPEIPLAGATSSRSDDEAALDTWTPPPGAAVHERVESRKEDRMFAAPAPEPFVNETMAQLYLQQGYRQLALRVYYQLAEARPNDQALKDRIAQIEAEDRAAHPDAAVEARREEPVERSSEAPAREEPAREAPRAEAESIAARQPSVREFFATLGRRRPPRPTGNESGGSRRENSATSDAGSSLGVSPPPASLDAVFAGATVNPADSRAAARLAGAFSGAVGTSRSTPTPAMPTPRMNPRLPQAQESEEDVAKFRAWLDGLTGE